MATDWNGLKGQYDRKFKDYAPKGKYTVEVVSAEVKDTTTGSVRVVFEFAEDDQYKYPKSVAHWISRKNINWTKWHHSCLLQVLGVSEAKAQEAIDKVETDKATLEQIVKGYQALYSRAVSKHPKVEIEVRDQYDRDGNLVTSDKGFAYSESEFVDSRVHTSNRPAQTASADPETTEELPLGGEEIDLSDVPF